MSRFELSAKQAAAVQAQEVRTFVTAGAGSGKTRVLVERIAYLIEVCHSSPYEIVAVTFTRAAAQEVSRRLEARIGPEARRVTVGTLHGIALGLLKRFGDTIGLRPGKLSVYNETEAAALLESLAREMGVLKGKTWKIPKRSIDATFAAYEQRGEEPGENNPALALFQAFQRRCLENSAMTYSGLIAGLRRLVFAGSVKEYTNWKHILVDEAQDLDMLQWSILEKLHKDGCALYAVGDISQAIYGFRGAMPEYLFREAQEGRMMVYELTDNYRSMAAIVQAANALIWHNKIRLDYPMVPTYGEGTQAIWRLDSVNSETLAQQILEKGWVDGPPETIAILCRNNRMLDKLSSELILRAVPHRRIGKRTSMLHSMSFVRVHALLKLAANEHDNTAFMLAQPLLVPDVAEYAALRERAAEAGHSHFTEYRKTALRELPGINVFLKATSAMTDAAEWFKDADYIHREDLGADWSGPYLWLAEWADQHSTATVTDYLAWLAVVDVQDEVPVASEDDKPELLLMTVHASKGLEFPHVIIFGLNEGLMPSKQAVASGELEEERRISYVAVTRARSTLTLAVRPDDPPSRFIAEMVEA